MRESDSFSRFAARGLPFLLGLVAAVSALPAQSPQASQAPQGRRFAFSYNAGDKFRVLSVVDEEVYVNHRFLSRSQISNRIAFEVAEASPDSSSGLLRGSFITEEIPEGSTVPLITESYDSEFRRDARGVYTIDPKYYMPVVRDCPVFPDRVLLPGESWTAPGEEKHDLRRVFGIGEPYAIPFVASYRYEGETLHEGKACSLISAAYTIFTQPGPPPAYTDVYPIQIAGFSDQSIYWDPELGAPLAYEERFKLIFDWSDGSTVEYRGRAGATVVEAQRMDRPALKAAVEDAVGDLANVSVSQNELGVTISIEDIRFRPDSALLLPEELAKIAKIAGILAAYPERDILVAGHTALAGGAEGRQKLSEERATAVAQALVAAGAGGQGRIHAVGYGAERPIADNATSEGMARNRRVEITILEN
jgi:outer membrane protein OmpA-like peptidoglycan-associated protein